MTRKEVPPGYRKTEVGLIPEDWEVKKIGEITTCTSGGTPNTEIASYWGGDVPWMSSGELHLKFVRDVKGRITEEGLSKSSAKIIPKKCILIGLAGQGKTRGTVAINLIQICTNQSIGAILPNSNFVPEYLYHNFDSRYDELRKLSTGASGRGGLNLSIIKSIKIPLPPLPEQHAIATALSDADALITSLDTLIEKKRAIKQAAMQQLLAGKTRLPGFAKSSGVKNTEVGVIPEDWEVLSIGKICTLYNGRAYALFEWEKTGVPVIRLQNLTGSSDYYYSRLNLPEHKYCIKGDLLYMWSATFGPHIWNGERAIYHYHIWKVVHRDELVNKMYLYYKLAEITEEKKTRAANGGTMLHVTKLSMESTLLALPPLPEQTAIATVLSDIDDEITALEERLEKTQQIKQGMMQQLLTGRIRLPALN